MSETGASAAARAAALADEIADGLRRGRAVEWVEELLVHALGEMAREERDRCAEVAEGRAATWRASARRMTAPGWPEVARAEARARQNEALVIADALRAGGLRAPGEQPTST